LNEAPQAPKKDLRFIAAFVLFAFVIWWSFEGGAKVRPAERHQGIPQIFATVGRMLPPDFSKVTDRRTDYSPEGVTQEKLFLPIFLSDNEARIKQRWWDNRFPQTVLGATLDTMQTVLAGTFFALLAAFPLGFLAARNTTPHSAVYHACRLALNFFRTIPSRHQRGHAHPALWLSGQSEHSTALPGARRRLSEQRVHNGLP